MLPPPTDLHRIIGSFYLLSLLFLQAISRIFVNNLIILTKTNSVIQKLDHSKYNIINIYLADFFPKRQFLKLSLDLHHPSNQAISNLLLINLKTRRPKQTLINQIYRLLTLTSLKMIILSRSTHRRFILNTYLFSLIERKKINIALLLHLYLKGLIK